MPGIIKTRKELDFYLMADMMMNRGYFKKRLLRKVYELYLPDEVMDYLRAMRFYSYFTPPTSSHLSLFKSFLFLIPSLYYKRKFIHKGNRLGFYIGKESFGYGLVIHHPGTIIVGDNNVIGNYALLNTSTCITQNGSRIGNGFFMGSGAKIINKVELGDNTWAGANTVINKSFPNGGVLVGGVPGKQIKENSGEWYDTLYGEQWKERHAKVDELRKKMFG